jgi:very-short-patch-repair endonuclease
VTIRWTPEQYDAWKKTTGKDPARVELPTDPKPANAGAALSAKRERSSAAPDLEGALVVDLMQAGLGGFERNYQFDTPRRWELDFAWLSARVAIEVQGGVHSRGAHVRPDGFKRDCRKSRRAQLMGWIVFPCTSADLKDRSIIADVETALELRRPGGLR